MRKGAGEVSFLGTASVRFEWMDTISPEGMVLDAHGI